MHTVSLKRMITCLSLFVLISVGCVAVSFPFFAKVLSMYPQRRQIARVAGKPIYDNQLPAAVVGQVQQLRRQEFEVERTALEELVHQQLLDIEANKRGTSIDGLLESEVSTRVADPAPSDVMGYYLAHKTNISQPMEQAAVTIREALKQARAKDARDSYLERLQQENDVVFFLQTPKVEVSYDTARVLGNPGAPVTVIEFSDFTCPFCQRAESALKEVLTNYRGKVKLAYRDFPLTEIHPYAQLAAEASRCAGEQAKFWEYHDLLFSNPNKVSLEDLVQNAKQLRLDEMRFTSCLKSGRYNAQIERDMEDGTRAGVFGTPAFFINGVYLGGSKPASAFQEIIDEELQSANRKRAQD